MPIIKKMFLAKNFLIKNILIKMDQNLEKKSLLEYLKSNLKIIISIIFLILLIGISILWLDYNKKNQRVKNSENYINAKVLIKNKEYESSLKILE